MSAELTSIPGPSARRGWKRLLNPVRRLARRALRPILLRLDALDARLAASLEEMKNVHARVDDVADRIEGTVALAWDYAATVRRLAVLEDRVEALMAKAEAAEQQPIRSRGDAQAA